jgi:hypothetical protein
MSARYSSLDSFPRRVETTTDPKTKKRVGQGGNYVEVYKKQADGTWKVEEDIGTEETPVKVLKRGD